MCLTSSSSVSPVEETSTQREWEPGALASLAVKKAGRREEEDGRRVEGESGRTARA